MNATQLLPAIRDLCPRHPEYFHHEPWELAHVHFTPGYVEDLAGEPKIDAAVEVVRQDWPLWRSAA